MSSTATSKVGLFSKAKGSEKLLLLAYAETAHQDGTGSCPGMPTLCQWTGLTPNGVRQVRERLLQKGEIKIRPDLDPTYKTAVIDIVFGDGSNAAVIAALYPPEAPVEDTPSKDCGVKSLEGQKFAPESVVVSSESSSGSESEKTTTDLGQKFAGSKVLTPSAESAAPLVGALLGSWRDCGLEGEYLHALAEALSQRPDGATESDDILDYWEAWNQYAATDRRLGPGWIVVQLKALAAMSPTSPREFRWMHHAPPKAAQPEYWRKYTAEADPWAAQASHPDSLLNRLGRPEAETPREERAA